MTTFILFQAQEGGKCHIAQKIAVADCSAPLRVTDRPMGTAPLPGWLAGWLVVARLAGRFQTRPLLKRVVAQGPHPIPANDANDAYNNAHSNSPSHPIAQGAKRDTARSTVSAH